MGWIKARKGDKWKRLECLGVESKLVNVKEEGTGVTFQEQQHVYTFACDCGKKFTLTNDEFKGKRSLPDCGCGISSDEGRAVMRSFTIPIKISEAIDRYANTKTHGNKSLAIADLLRRSLEEEKAG